MDLTNAQIIELIVTLIACMVVLIASYSAPMKVSVGIVLVMIPFQPVETKYYSANVLMTFVLFGALMLRGRIHYLPKLGAILAVLFAYLISLSQVHRALWIEHTIPIFFLVSGFLVFMLAYNLARQVESPRFVINLFIASNVLVVLYCILQFSVGPGERLVFFGIDQLSMHRNRGGGDPRLVGPFGSPTVSSAYFMSIILILVFELVHSSRRRRLALSGLAAMNLAMLMATGNRGSFMLLVVGLLGFLYLFRHTLGVTRVIQVLVASIIIVTGLTALLATYSEFGNLLARLTDTEFTETGVPDTREKVWREAWSVIPERLWLGHGPRLVPPSEYERVGRVHPEQLVIEHPHNLALYLLVTVGMLGMLCVFFFLFSVVWGIYRGVRLPPHVGTDYEKQLVMVGLLVAALMLLDQIKVEFLRRTTVDYAHFLFANFGIFLGIADRLRRQLLSEERPLERSTSHVAPSMPSMAHRPAAQQR